MSSCFNTSCVVGFQVLFLLLSALSTEAQQQQDPSWCASKSCSEQGVSARCPQKCGGTATESEQEESDPSFCASKACSGEGVAVQCPRKCGQNSAAVTQDQEQQEDPSWCALKGCSEPGMAEGCPQKCGERPSESESNQTAGDVDAQWCARKSCSEPGVAEGCPQKCGERPVESDQTAGDADAQWCATKSCSQAGVAARCPSMCSGESPNRPASSSTEQECCGTKSCPVRCAGSALASKSSGALRGKGKGATGKGGDFMMMVVLGGFCAALLCASSCCVWGSRNLLKARQISAHAPTTAVVIGAPAPAQQNKAEKGLPPRMAARRDLPATACGLGCFTNNDGNPKGNQ